MAIDREKLLSIGFLKGGQTGSRTREYRDDDTGERVKETTLESGTVLTDHAIGDRRDVTLRPETIHMTGSVQGGRS